MTTALSFWILVVGGEPIEELRRFYERTFQIQFDRRSPFSLWDWGQYRAGPARPPLAPAALAGGPRCSCACARVRPTPKSPFQLAALTAALLMGFQLALTHWSALYIAWFFPFVALALFAGAELGGVVSKRAPLRLPLRSERPATRESPAV